MERRPNYALFVDHKNVYIELGRLVKGDSEPSPDVGALLMQVLGRLMETLGVVGPDDEVGE